MGHTTTDCLLLLGSPLHTFCGSTCMPTLTQTHTHICIQKIRYTITHPASFFWKVGLLWVADASTVSPVLDVTQPVEVFGTDLRSKQTPRTVCSSNVKAVDMSRTSFFVDFTVFHSLHARTRSDQRSIVFEAIGVHSRGSTAPVPRKKVGPQLTMNRDASDRAGPDRWSSPLSA